MKTVLLCSCTLMMFVVATACDGLFGDEDDLELTGIVWQLVAFEETNGQTTGVGTADFLIIFVADTVKGLAVGVEDNIRGNIYSSRYEINPMGELSIEPIFSTTKGLRPGSRYNEFLRALEAAFRFEIKGKRLRM